MADTIQQAPSSNKATMIQHCRNLVRQARRRIQVSRSLRRVERTSTLCVHRIDPRNTGDINCAPGLYVDFLSGFLTVDLYQCDAPNRLASKLIVMGGGGLLSPFFDVQLKALTSAPKARLISWGMGHNVHGATRFELHPALEHFELVGLRDYKLCQENNRGYEWVPCVSCLTPLLDQNYYIQHDHVIFEHHNFRVAGLDPAIPRMMNDGTDLAEVLSFLGSAETVLTTTFHGAYWSTLLGKKVVVVDPCSNRFFGLKHAPVMGPAQDWRSLASQARSYPEALQECRAANLAFADKVRTIVENHRRSVQA